ncbi:MAG TPA: energy transducer TonB, partial [Ferruginibacter sp.]|nr:energy transducer TonB [Ferruginibacter sp.]
FENRNKEYGAYNLRKFYQNRLYKSISIMLTGVMLLCLLMFMQTNRKSNASVYITKETTLADIYRPKSAVEAKPKAAQKQVVQKQVAVKPVQQNAGSKILFVKDSVKQIIQPVNLNATPMANTTVSTTQPGSVNGGVIAGAGNEKSTGEAANSTAIDINTPLNSADVYPSFPGGDEALRKFLLANLKTPEDMPDDATISVQVEFVVGYDGKLKSFKVVKDGGDDFNNEVIRVLKKMPNWIPGKAKGQNVSVYHIIPVKFVSQDANP